VNVRPAALSRLLEMRTIFIVDRTRRSRHHLLWI
jgi:hypothetical protein